MATTRTASTQQSGLLERTKSDPKVTSGINTGAKILLLRIEHEGQRRTGAFVYPSSLELTPALIQTIHPTYGEGELVTEKESKSRTPEELSRDFKKESGMISMMDYQFQFRTAKVIDHAFPLAAANYLADVINDLKD